MPHDQRQDASRAIQTSKRDHCTCSELCAVKIMDVEFLGLHVLIGKPNHLTTRDVKPSLSTCLQSCCHPALTGTLATFDSWGGPTETLESWASQTRHLRRQFQDGSPTRAAAAARRSRGPVTLSRSSERVQNFRSQLRVEAGVARASSGCKLWPESHHGSDPARSCQRTSCARHPIA